MKSFFSKITCFLLGDNLYIFIALLDIKFCKLSKDLYFSKSSTSICKAIGEVNIHAAQ
jgi:hypothetical protein